MTEDIRDHMHYMRPSGTEKLVQFTLKNRENEVLAIVYVPDNAGDMDDIVTVGLGQLAHYYASFHLEMVGTFSEIMEHGYKAVYDFENYIVTMEIFSVQSEAMGIHTPDAIQGVEATGGYTYPHRM